MTQFFGTHNSELLRILAAYAGNDEYGRAAKEEAQTWLDEMTQEPIAEPDSGVAAIEPEPT